MAEARRAGRASRASSSTSSTTRPRRRSSPATTTGKHIEDATFSFRRGGDNPLDFLTIKLTDVLVTGYQQGGTKEPPLLEGVALDAAKIEIEYKPQNPDGSLGSPVRASYDLEANKLG